MSFFDYDFMDAPPTLNRQFFTRITDDKFFENFSTVFACSISYSQKNGTEISAKLKIVDHKLIIFKNKKAKKYIDLKEIYVLEAFATSDQNNYGENKNLLVFTRFSIKWKCFVDQKSKFFQLLQILRRYCVLTNFTKNYDIVKFLGQGHFAEVFSVENLETKQKFAAKIFKKNSEVFSKSSKLIKNEIEIMRMLPENENTVKLYEIYEDSENLILILQMMHGKSLERMITHHKNLTESQIFKIFFQILKGLSFLHSQGIIHRDIKPDNILFVQKKKITSLRIADFGLAEKFSSSKTFTTICGTPGFMAPEILSNEPYDEKIDVYSLGLVLFTLLTGKPPFKGKSLNDVLWKNRTGKIKFISSDWEKRSHDSKKTVKYMLRKHPNDRISLSDIYELKWVRKMLTAQEITPLLPHNSTVDDFLHEDSSLIKRDFKSLVSCNNSASNDQKCNDCSTNVEEHKSQKVSDKKCFLEFLSINKQQSASTCVSIYSQKLSASFWENYQLNSFLVSGNKRNEFSSNEKSSGSSSKSLNSPIIKVINSNEKHEIIEECEDKLMKNENLEANIEFSCRTKKNDDLDLSIVVPGLYSIAFKGKMF